MSNTPSDASTLTLPQSLQLAQTHWNAGQAAQAVHYLGRLLTGQ